MTDRPSITPHTRVGDLLDAYPDVEEVLIEFAPAFAKLRNPVLRRTVAKVATLEKAAAIAGVSVRDLVDALRQAVGQPTAESEPPAAEYTPATPSGETPDWLDDSRVTESLDADAMLDTGEHPLGVVQRRLTDLPPGSILRVTSSFHPVPLIEHLQSQGLRVHTAEKGGRFETYVESNANRTNG
ncbi:MAG: DUF1858 domain-containing protein [Candidatus Latescibacteria bacterium]|nr:DUF1858 domain-containing protein [Candidatus Latescibacterota bacterium]